MLLLLIIFGYSLKYLVSSDRRTLTIEGLSEIVDLTSYRNSGSYTNYYHITIKYGITGLGPSSLRDSINLLTIDLPTSLNSIGSECFLRCSNLQRIIIPDGVKQIFKGTFLYCIKLQLIDLPSSITYIAEENTFYNCDSLKEFVTHENCRFSTMNDGAILVENNTIGVASAALSKIVIPKEITKLRKYFLNGMTTIKEIEFIGNNLEYVEDMAFRATEQLLSITLPYGVLSVGSSIMTGSKVSYLHLPSSLLHLSVNAFDGAAELKEVIIDEQCSAAKQENGIVYSSDSKSILFINSGKTNLTIIESITNINPATLQGNKNLVHIEVKDGNGNFSSDGQILYNKNKSTLICGIGGIKYIKVARECTTISSGAFSGIEAETLEFLGENVSLISTTAFYQCSIKSANFSNGLNTIETMGFSTTLLKKIVLPSTITSIGAECFAHNPSTLIDLSQCLSLKAISFSAFLGNTASDVRLPSNLSYVGDQMFESCKNLKTISIPPLVNSLGKRAFYSSGLINISFEGNSLITINDNCFDSTKIQSIQFPDSVREFGIGVLSKCEELESIIFNKESQLRKIREDFIKGSNKLNRIWLGHEVEEIMPTALGQAISLVEIEFDENNRKYIGYKGLVVDIISDEIVGCGGGVKKVFIESSIKSIGSSAFLNCENLEEVNFSTESHLQTVGKSTFLGCSSIISFSLPRYLKSIEENAFSKCGKLKSVDFGDNTKERFLNQIGDNAFNGCLELVLIELPISLEIIGNNSFNGCNKLEKIILGNRIRIIGSDVFNGCKQMKLILYCFDIGSELKISERAFIGLPEETNIFIPESYGKPMLGGRKVYRILDHQCNIPTGRFTKRNVQSSLEAVEFLAAVLQTESEEETTVELEDNKLL